MKRSLIVLAVLGLVLAACGGGGSTVATVDGTDIPLADVESLSPSAGNQPRDEFSQNLLLSIAEVAVVQRADSDFGISFTDEEIDARYEELKAEVVPDGVEYEDFLEQQGVTDERVRRIAHQFLLQNAITEQLVAEAGPITDDDVQAAFDDQKASLTEGCVSHILTETEESALTAKDRLDAGEEFATVAAEVSTDPSAADNQGDLGCGPLGQYVPEFAAGAAGAEIGVVTAPVRSQFGYHLILVTERTDPVFEEIAPDIREQLEAQQASTVYNDWVLEVLNEATVEVDARYGSWTTDPSPQVLPPE